MTSKRRQYSVVQFTSLVLIQLSATLAFAATHLAQNSTPVKSDESDVFDMSIDKLVNVSVSVASKSEEESRAAAAIISVVTADDIQRFGARSLVDVINRVTGLYMMSTYAYPNNMIAVRGDVTNEYNNRVLVLIDGRPFRESAFLGENRAIWTMMPISDVQQIEVLRGPGSVLYGTSAFDAVINVRTKSFTGDRVSAEFTYGSFDTKKLDAHFEHAFNDWQLTGSVDLLNTRGWTFNMTDERGYTRSTDMSESGEGLTLKLKRGEFTVQTFMAENTMGTIGNTPIWGPDNVPSTLSPSFVSSLRDWDYKSFTRRIFTTVGVDHVFSSDWHTQFNFDYNHFDFKFYYPQAIQTSRIATSDDELIEITNFYTINSDLKWMLGALGWKGSASGSEPAFDSSGAAYDIYSPGATTNAQSFSFIPAHEFNYAAVYSELEYQATSAWTFVAGAQTNLPQDQAAVTVPRLGIVHKSGENWISKVLYGEAFRSPSISEKYRISTSATGDPNLKPESVRTTEAQLIYKDEHCDASLVAFKSEGSNLIYRTTSTPRKYVNLGDSQTTGFEIEGHVRAFGATFQEGLSAQLVTLNGTGDPNQIPVYLVKTGVGYDWNFGLSAGLFDSFVSQAPGSYSNVVNPDADSYHNVSLNLTLDMHRATGWTSRESETTVKIYGTNLLNQSIYFAEYGRQKINTIPGGAGRAVYVAVEAGI
jgi:outer membrane receptor protein involved in Fe transport